MTSTLSASALRAIERRANHKLALLRHVEEVSGNVAASCRYYGVSRQAYYVWLKRYEAEGFEGLKDRSSAPHHSPTALAVAGECPAVTANFAPDPKGPSEVPQVVVSAWGDVVPHGL